MPWFRKDGRIYRNDPGDIVETDKYDKVARIHIRKMQALISDIKGNNDWIAPNELSGFLTSWILDLFRRDSGWDPDKEVNPFHIREDIVISDKSRELMDFFEKLNWSEFDQSFLGDIYQSFLSKEYRQTHGIDFT